MHHVAEGLGRLFYTPILLIKGGQATSRNADSRVAMTFGNSST